ncbi:hypothetical protein [Eikenella corrodens]|jgi:hypothetical protein|uniref:hypothetical protein n=1 Tax=Eikenella corrodens TaxID=539 RepID=UPI00129AE4C6|nr:hypothetical protein [Eikenella corrodens]
MSPINTDETLQTHILLKIAACRGEAISFQELAERIYAQDISSPDYDAVKRNLIFLHDKGFIHSEDINPKEPYFAVIKITEAGLRELEKRNLASKI